VAHRIDLRSCAWAGPIAETMKTAAMAAADTAEMKLGLIFDIGFLLAVMNRSTFLICYGPNLRSVSFGVLIWIKQHGKSQAHFRQPGEGSKQRPRTLRKPPEDLLAVPY